MSSALAAITAFNLICTATYTEASGASRNVVETIRLDLAQMRFCDGKCERTFEIRRINRSEIVLREGPVTGTSLVSNTRINRETGSYISETKGSFGTLDLTGWTIGKCNKAPFSGFPRQRF